MSNTKIISTPLFGSIKVDASIANLIYELNNSGVLTMNCCSGIIEDHPKEKWILNSNSYIQFVTNQELWDFLCKNQGLFTEYDIAATLSITLHHPSIGEFDNNICIRFNDKDNEVRKAKWAVIKRLFGEYIGKNII